MNYAERIAYWYLRLNGFFPITNFVLHRIRENDNAQNINADCDLIGIRMPDVYEEIENKTVTEDFDSFRKWDVDFKKNKLGFIVEVKSGTINLEIKAFREERIKCAIRRMGCLKKNRINLVVKELKDASFVKKNGWIIAKLLIRGKNEEERDGCLNLTLEEANDFIISRIKTHGASKSGAKLFFPDELMQYIMWKTK